MVYLVLLLYVSAIYVRPAEIIPAWGALPFVELLSIVAVVVVVLAYVREPRGWDGLPHDWFLLGFWLAIVVSNLAWGWLGGALKGFVEFFRIVFFYFLLRFAVRGPRQLRGLMALLVGLAVLQAANGIMQYYTGRGVGDVELMRHGRIRGTGIFNDPNDLAQALLMVVPFLLVAVGGRGVSPGRRLLGLLALAPILLALVFTDSRGAALGFGLIVVVLAVWRFGRVTGVVASIVVLAVVVVAGPRRILEITPSDGSVELFAEPVTETASGEPTISGREESYRERIEAWSEGLTLLRTRPVFGVGYSRFLDFHELVAHNSFIHTFAELGLVGAFFGMGLVYWFFRGLRASPAGRRRAALAMSGVAVLVTSSFLSRQYDFVLYTLLGLGACHAAMTTDPDHRLTTTGRDLGNILLLTVGAVVMVKVAVTVLTAWSRG